MSEPLILTLQDKYAVEAYVKQLIGTWLKWLGIANGTAVLLVFYYVVIELPPKAAAFAGEAIVTSVSEPTAILKGDLQSKYGELFELSGRIGESQQSLQRRTTALTQVVDEIEKQVKTVQGTNLAGVAALVDAASKSGDTIALIERIKALEGTLAELGNNRSGPSFSIDNPRMPGPDSAECPAGTYVSSVQASGAVGGKYAIDGISKITFTCSPIR